MTAAPTDRTAAGQDRGKAAEEVATQAAEEMLGPNPFVGLRPSDLVASLTDLGRQVFQAPMMALRHETQLASTLFSVVTGSPN
jgi:polyhydroxyalkanoate synthase